MCHLKRNVNQPVRLSSYVFYLLLSVKGCDFLFLLSGCDSGNFFLQGSRTLLSTLSYFYLMSSSFPSLCLSPPQSTAVPLSISRSPSLGEQTQTDFSGLPSSHCLPLPPPLLPRLFCTFISSCWTSAPSILLILFLELPLELTFFPISTLSNPSIVECGFLFLVFVACFYKCLYIQYKL